MVRTQDIALLLAQPHSIHALDLVPAAVVAVVLVAFAIALVTVSVHRRDAD
jgi:hypothetical protein